MIVEEGEPSPQTRRRQSRVVCLCYDRSTGKLWRPGSSTRPAARGLPDIAPTDHPTTRPVGTRASRATGLRVRLGGDAAGGGAPADGGHPGGHVGAWAPKPEQCDGPRMLDEGRGRTPTSTRCAPRPASSSVSTGGGGGFAEMRATVNPVEAIAPQGAINLLPVTCIPWPANEATRQLMLAKAGTRSCRDKECGMREDSGWSASRRRRVARPRFRRRLPAAGRSAGRGALSGCAQNAAAHNRNR